MKNLARACLTILALSFAACSQAPQQAVEPPDTRAADEAAIRAAVKEWSASAQAKDVEKFVSFYAEDAVLMVEDAPDVSGKGAIRDGFSEMMQDPNFALSFGPTGVEVARSGDLAFETGDYTIAMTDPETKQATSEKGHYVVVWRKQADGQWKVVRDVPVSDGPEPSGR